MRHLPRGRGGRCRATALVATVTDWGACFRHLPQTWLRATDALVGAFDSRSGAPAWRGGGDETLAEGQGRRCRATPLQFWTGGHAFGICLKRGCGGRTRWSARSVGGDGALAEGQGVSGVKPDPPE